MKKIVLVVLCFVCCFGSVMADNITTVTYNNKDGSRTNVTYMGDEVFVSRQPSTTQRVKRVGETATRIYTTSNPKPSDDANANGTAAIGSLVLAGLVCEPVTTLAIAGVVVGGLVIWSGIKSCMSNTGN